VAAAGWGGGGKGTLEGINRNVRDAYGKLI
jgi:hypothetical protein